MAMILIGSFESPFVRRVAVSMHWLGIAFDHLPWSAWDDTDRIRAFNPIERVPVLVLEDGTTVIEGESILDYLDELAGSQRALVPTRGSERMRVKHATALAVGVCDIGTQLMSELRRPPSKQHAPWVARLRALILAGLRELDSLRFTPWLLGTRLSQADISAAVATDFVRSTVPMDQAFTLDRLDGLVAQCAELAPFRSVAQLHLVPHAEAADDS